MAGGLPPAWLSSSQRRRAVVLFSCNYVCPAAAIGCVCPWGACRVAAWPPWSAAGRSSPLTHPHASLHIFQAFICCMLLPNCTLLHLTAPSRTHLIVPYSTLLHLTSPFCTHLIVPYCTLLHLIAPYCTILYLIAPYCTHLMLPTPSARKVAAAHRSSRETGGLRPQDLHGPSVQFEGVVLPTLGPPM